VITLTDPDIMTIRRKLIFWFAAVLAVILVFFGAIFFGVTRWVLVNSVDSALNDTVQQVMINTGTISLPDIDPENGVIIRLPELDIFRASGVVVQAWRLQDGAAQYAGSSSNIANHHAPLDSAALRREIDLIGANQTNEQVWSDVPINGGWWRVVSRPIMIWGEPFVLQAAMSLDQVNSASRSLLLIIGIAMALALFGTCAMGWAMANRMLRRIDAITQSARQIVSADDLNRRLPYAGPMDEIGRMTDVFNQMLGRMEHIFSVQRRFLGDASHELRTPLTAIRGHVDLIKKYGSDPASLEALESEVIRMNRLVSDLLMLAKADYGGIKIELKPVDLDDLVSEIYRQAQVLAKDRDLKITVRDYEPVRVNADADRLKQLMLNLINNAIKFTPDGGTITLNLRRTPNDAILEVCDTGIGISAEDQLRVFDRFYQVDESRARGFGVVSGQVNDGVGLGLSIAKWITEAHGGKITVSSEVGVGTHFTVAIPHMDAQTAPDAITRPRISILSRRDKTGERNAAARSESRHE
jgi:signal transduction histidine kinase